ncbi:Translocation protein SEC62 [Meyerozyma sp. JA9]|jgi:translocation protein SEC62|nr:Translocation protein SEC62 [Meyerozyma sp. JA9]
MSVQVPVSDQRSPATIRIANYLRDNKILKMRTGLLNNTSDVDFFRFKRIIRALTSEDYKKKQSNPKNELIPIESDQEAAKVFIQLIQNQLVTPVEKLHYAEVKQYKGWKPDRNKPTLKPTTKANLEPNAYYVWNYTKPNPYLALYGLLMFAGVFAVILFPLWPAKMKIGVWYLSMGMLGLIGLFFAIAFVRLIIYVVTLLTMKQAFWLYPNLFADCGVIDSFKPLYEWEQDKKAKKSKKSKKSPTSEPSETSGTTTGASASAANATKRRVVLEEVDE